MRLGWPIPCMPTQKSTTFLAFYWWHIKIYVKKKQIKNSDFPPILLVRGEPSCKNTVSLIFIWKWYINWIITKKIFMCYQYNSNSVPHYNGTLLEIPPTETIFVGMPKWWVCPTWFWLGSPTSSLLAQCINKYLASYR